MLLNVKEAVERLRDYDLTEALKNDEPHDIIHEIADGECDVYNGKLLEWVAEADNYQYIEDAIEEFGFPTDQDDKPSFMKAIQVGQYQQQDGLLWEAWEILTKLENARKSLKAENISYGEIAELQDLAEYIDPSDVELLEAAGVPEFTE